ncbi:MAG TPA: hypothetical protein VG755_18165 [Nannocystaceae bacterium]|nr:hypothetical protein [Nannocystaceae bacterium]
MLAASTLLATVLALGDTILGPEFTQLDLVPGPGKQVPLAMVAAANGEHFVVYSKPDAQGWPEPWVDHYAHNGARTWSYRHPLTRLPAGQGFDYVRAVATGADGALYLAYHSTLNGSTSGMFALASDNTLAWDHALVKCSGRAAIFELGASHDVLMSFGVGATRRAAASGAEIWKTTWPQAGLSEDDQHAAIDGAGNVYVVARVRSSKSGEQAHGALAIYKVSADGALLWRRSTTYHDHQHPTPKLAFVPADDGLVAAFLNTRASADDAIEVHKYDVQGRLLAKHSTDLGLNIGSYQALLAVRAPDDAVQLAWDDRKLDHSATKWSTTSVGFARKKGGPAQASGNAAIGPTVVSMSWQGHTLATQELVGAAYDQLVDMTVDDEGRVYMVGVDIDDGDGIRVAVLPRAAGGTIESRRWQRNDRHARPLRIATTDTRIYVLGADDTLAGPSAGGDSDVVHLAFRKRAKARPTKKRTTAIPAMD